MAAVPTTSWCSLSALASHASPSSSAPAGRPIFKKSPRVLFLTPGMVKIGFLTPKYPDFNRQNHISTDFWKIEISEKSIFSKIDHFLTFYRYFEAREHQNRTRHEKILPGSYYEIFWPDGRLIGARRRSWTFTGHEWASHQAKKSQNKTPKIFFMPRSILVLSGLKIPIKI